MPGCTLSAVNEAPSASASDLVCIVSASLDCAYIASGEYWCTRERSFHPMLPPRCITDETLMTRPCALASLGASFVVSR